MAQTEHPPIYQRTYDLCLHLEQVARAFPRYQKYSLGADLRDAARRALRLVVRANSRHDKAPVLLELREELEELKPSCGSARTRTRSRSSARSSTPSSWW